MRKFLAAALASVLLVGCGSTASKTVLGHPCSGKSYVQQCALTPPQKQQLSIPLTTIYANGVDFAWSCPSGNWAFGASYLSNSSKDWTSACIARFKEHIFVWETSANESQNGFGAGASDARAASAEAARLGNTNRPIFFAIDCDCTPTGARSYFQGVRSVLPLNRTGVYGGYNQVKYLFDVGLVGYGWQTYAWSGGAWDPRAHLEQWLNGSSVDQDRAIAADYGQWPYAVAPPPDPYAIYLKTVFHFGSQTASEYNTVKTWDAHKCANPARRTVCVTTHAHLVDLKGRLYYVAHHPLVNGKATWNLFARGTRYAGISKRVG